MTDVLSNLSRCIENYKGQKLSFVATGGGLEIFKLAQTPGSSKVLNAIYVPYATEESIGFISEHISPIGLELVLQKNLSVL